MRERLYRSREDRMLFGVAGGMAEWMDLDPALVRLVWAVLVLAGGVGLVLYIVAAIVMPEGRVGAPSDGSGAPSTGSPGSATDAASMDQSGWEARRTRRAARRQGSGNPGMLFGLILVIAGGWILISRYLPAFFDTSWVVPGVLIVVGIALLVGAMGRSTNSGS